MAAPNPGLLVAVATALPTRPGEWQRPLPAKGPLDNCQVSPLCVALHRDWGAHLCIDHHQLANSPGCHIVLCHSMTMRRVSSKLGAPALVTQDAARPSASQPRPSPTLAGTRNQGAEVLASSSSKGTATVSARPPGAAAPPPQSCTEIFTIESSSAAAVGAGHGESAMPREGVLAPGTRKEG